MVQSAISDTKNHNCCAFAIFCDILSNILLCNSKLRIRKTTIVEFFEDLMCKSNPIEISAKYKTFYVLFKLAWDFITEWSLSLFSLGSCCCAWVSSNQLDFTSFPTISMDTCASVFKTIFWLNTDLRSLASYLNDCMTTPTLTEMEQNFQDPWMAA